MKAAMINIEGQGKADVKATLVSVNGSAMTQIKAVLWCKFKAQLQR